MAELQRWKIWKRSEPKGKHVHRLGETAYAALAKASGSFAGAHPSDLDCELDQSYERERVHESKQACAKREASTRKGMHERKHKRG